MHIPPESISRIKPLYRGANMKRADMAEDTVRQDVLKRLKRIEGQVKGVQRMIEDDKYCADILTQIAAIRAAINRVGGIILEGHSRRCMEKAVTAEERERVMKDLIDTVQRFLKFVD